MRCAALLGALLVVLCGQVHAAEPHEWITKNPRYVDASALHCCGPSHCLPARSGEVVRQPQGWLHVPTGTTLPDGVRGIYDSEDGRTWVCAYGRKIRCLFRATRM